MRLKNKLLALLLAVAPFGMANAIPVIVDFTADSFPVGAPDPVVSGQLVYDAADEFSAINSLTSIDLTIAGHTYSLGEVGFQAFGSSALVGGTACSVGCIVHGTNDFWLIWNPASHTPSQLAYSSTGAGFYSSSSFSKFSVTTVPEPASLALMGLGLAAVGLRRRKKAKVAA